MHKAKTIPINCRVYNNATEVAVGTIEGFCGETGVLRIDICSEYEKACYLSELFNFASDHFYAFFGNEYIVTKEISKALERHEALTKNKWEIIDAYRKFHGINVVRRLLIDLGCVGGLQFSEQRDSFKEFNVSFPTT